MFVGFPWSHRDEFGRRVGLNHNNYNARFQYQDPRFSRAKFKVPQYGGGVDRSGDTACQM